MGTRWERAIARLPTNPDLGMLVISEPHFNIIQPHLLPRSFISQFLTLTTLPIRSFPDSRPQDIEIDMVQKIYRQIHSETFYLPIHYSV